ncbi:hypothetical protein [Paenibacillus illinoisensis]|uniref:hypothetical protein n=1 Tax=Paenibacillus illinoisensis TaxID=59845 RepID=UPI003D997EBD
MSQPCVQRQLSPLFPPSLQLLFWLPVLPTACHTPPLYGAYMPANALHSTDPFRAPVQNVQSAMTPDLAATLHPTTTSSAPADHSLPPTTK